MSLQLPFQISNATSGSPKIGAHANHHGAHPNHQMLPFFPHGFVLRNLRQQSELIQSDIAIQQAVFDEDLAAFFDEYLKGQKSKVL